MQITPQQTGATDRFEVASGSLIERLIFNNRVLVLAFCALLTAALSLPLGLLKINANFANEIPRHQSFILNYLENQDNLHGLGNTLQIVVQADQGNILNKSYIDTLRALNDEVFILPGVDRSYMQSLWTPNVRWQAVTDSGLNGDAVMPNNFQGTADDIARLAQNIQNSGQTGRLVAADMRSSMILVPLLDTDAATGRPVDYGELARDLDALRVKYAARGVTLHSTGFAMIVGDLIEGLRQIIGFFAVSAAIATAIVYAYTRCPRSTAVVVICSSLAVYWQLALLTLLGYSLDPYSVLVPFLIFAIGISHGSQKMNGVMQDIGRGRSPLIAARLTFRRLFIAGFTALMCDAVGFGVLMSIDIAAIRELAVIASIGVALLIVTNLILLPVLLSFTGVSKTAAWRSRDEERRSAESGKRNLLWRGLDLFTRRRYAAMALAGGVLLGIAGAVVGARVQIGDIDQGAPELRGNSLYNRDNAYISGHYAASSDIFVIMVKTPPAGCADYAALARIASLQASLDLLPGVISTYSLADFEKQMSVEFNEGSFAWYDLIPNQSALNEVISVAPQGVVNTSCDFSTIAVFLRDHKAVTLRSVVATTLNFSQSKYSGDTHFLLAAGNAGIDAATNIVVSQTNQRMLLEVYAAVIILSFITFRSWRAVIIAILPLVLTSILAQALMVVLGIGVKVATLPVTALGVGIGVDYALYIFSVTLANMRAGLELSEAYYRALIFTGKVVLLTGATLAAAVATWVFSPIKFQADMGVLLAFMFLWNMLGALVLLPALAAFLLPRKLTGLKTVSGPQSGL